MKSILGKIQQTAIHRPDAEAILSQYECVSYRQLQQYIEQVDLELQSLNVQTIAIYMSNSIEWIIADLAAANASLTIVPIPLFFSHEQVLHLIEDANVEVVIVGYDTELASLPFDLISYEKSESLDIAYITLQVKTASHSTDKISPDKITYTSGSTGNPKGVCLTGETIVSVVQSLADQLMEANIKRHISLLPYATLLENIAGIYLPLAMGHSIVTADVSKMGLYSNNHFCVDTFMTAVEFWQANSVILLPQMLKAIAEKYQPSKLSSLTFMAVGGGKVSSELIKLCHQQQLPVYEGYGLSECASVVSLNTPSAHRVGSVGIPLPHPSVFIDESGELIVKGSAMLGYLGEDKDSPASIASSDNLTSDITTGNIATGDIAYLDKDGFLYITGRKKNTIISSFGRNISPEWVESSFLVNPQIQQVAVFGEAQPCLSAIIITNSDVTEEMLVVTIKKINETLPDYARIKRWQIGDQKFCMENGQLTENGKLCRNVIHQTYKKFLDQLEEVA